MYKYLESNESFKDLSSDSAKNNFNLIMQCLENASCPDISYAPYYTLAATKTLNRDDFGRCLNYLCDTIFLDENNKLLSKELFIKRSNFKLDGYPYGFTSYDINKEKFIDIEGGKYQITPAIAIHELTHAILFLHKVPIPKRYEELLSIFNELRVRSLMGQEVQDEWLFNKIVYRLSYRIHIEDLSDKALQNHKISNEHYFESYFRMVNFVYALRLCELYSSFPEQVSQEVENILNNKNSIFDLLKKYNISLENEDTILAFKRTMTEFENVVNRYFKNEITCEASNLKTII